jgi:predicted hydrocarbon binding protein
VDRKNHAGRLFYPLVVVYRVDVREQLVGRTELFEFRRLDRHHLKRVLEVGDPQTSRLNRVEHHSARLAPITGEERLDAACSSDPRAIAARRTLRQSRQKTRMKKGQIARDDDDLVRRRNFESRIQSAQRSRPRYQIGVDLHVEIGEPSGVRRDDEDFLRHSLQDFELPYDDGTAMDDEPALVTSTEPARLAAREDRRHGRRHGHESSIMTEARVGRLLAACLHQAILDVLPFRLEFYEHWLTSEGMRDGSIGLAPMTAVLGFLRTEGESYAPIMTRAGQLAAEWSLMSAPATSRGSIAWLPGPLRTRAALRKAASVIRDVSSATRTSVRLKRHDGRITIRASLFCAVREPQSTPLCGFYAAAATETLTRLGTPAKGRIESCCAVNGDVCVVALEV